MPGQQRLKSGRGSCAWERRRGNGSARPWRRSGPGCGTLRANEQRLRGECAALEEEQAAAQHEVADEQEQKESQAAAGEEQAREQRTGEEVWKRERSALEEERAMLAAKGGTLEEKGRALEDRSRALEGCAVTVVQREKSCAEMRPWWRGASTTSSSAG